MESGTPSSAIFYKWLGWFEQNRQRVVYAAVAIAVLGLIVYFIVWRAGEKKKEAGRALAKAFVQQMTAGADRADATSYLAVASKYPGADAAAPAKLLAAAALFDGGKYAEAQAQFDQFAREHRDSPFVAEAQLGVAASLEAQGKTSEALTAYKNLVDRRPSEAVIPQAKYSLARLYDAQDKPELAYPLYEEVARGHFGSLGSYAGLRAEELKAKHPELAPAPTPMPAPSPFTLMTNAAVPVVSNAAVPAISNAAAPSPGK